MSNRKLFSTIFGMVVLSALVVVADAQMTDQAAREQARNAVRSQLHHDPGKFLQVQRDEELEQSLAIVVSRPSWSEFIFKVSETGDEIKENAVVHHISTDFDPTYTIAINAADGSTYRIRGFADSWIEFQRLMTAANVKVSSADQAEAISDFYRRVDPERLSVAPISSLLDFKQAAERQCQRGLSTFDADQKAFTAWWNHAKSLYAEFPFKQTATSRSGGYLVEWIVLSSAAKGNCGGTPLRARLEVRSDGHVGKVTFSPLGKLSRPAS